MGFSMELFILYPKKADETPHTVWTAHETISFGRVTRLEKLVGDRFRHLQYDHHQRASICVVSILLGKLFEKLSASPTEALAPPILIYNDPAAYWPETAAREPVFRESALKAVQGEVVDVERWLLNGGAPHETDDMHRHNQALQLEPDALRQHLEKSHPILHRPFLWEHCATLAGWILQARIAETDEWRELEKDPVSRALALAWYAHLREVGDVEARALCVFPMF